MMLSCPAHAGHAAFFATVEAEEATVAGAKVIRLHLRAPFVVTNALPATASIVIASGAVGRRYATDRNLQPDEVTSAGMAKVTLSLEEGASAELVKLDPAGAHFLSLALPAVRGLSAAPFVPLFMDDYEYQGPPRSVVRALAVADAQGRALELRVEISEVDHDSKGGGVRPVKVAVYAPMWIYDFTELLLRFSWDAKHEAPAALPAARGQRPPVLFAVASADVVAGKSNEVPAHDATLVMRSESNARNDWSAPVAVDRSAEAVVEVAAVVGSLVLRCELGVDIKAGSGAFYRTKIVTISPRYLIVNRLDGALQVRQVGDDKGPVTLLPPGGSLPWCVPAAARAAGPLLSRPAVRYAGTGLRTCPPMNGWSPCACSRSTRARRRPPPPRRGPWPRSGPAASRCRR